MIVVMLITHEQVRAAGALRWEGWVPTTRLQQLSRCRWATLTTIPSQHSGLKSMNTLTHCTFYTSTFQQHT